MHFLSAVWLSLVLQIITIIVLGVTCWAALKQADAARKLTEATKQQIETSKSMADSANAQTELARKQFEEGLRPLLALVTRLRPNWTEHAVRNDGAGPALWCFYYYGRIDTTFPAAIPLDSEVIAPDQEIRFNFDVPHARAEGLVLVYKSTAGTTSATEYIWRNDSHARCRYIMEVPKQVVQAGATVNYVR